MKNLIICLLIFIGVGCTEKPDIEQVVIEECVGASFYYIDNQTDKGFLVEFAAPVLNKPLDTNTVINMKQRVLIGQDAIFGAIPRPTGTFSSFVLYTLAEGKKNIIYRQDPVQNALWVKRKHNATDPDYGCQQVDFTLTITDDMLKENI
jgi:hypothetical protein